MRYLVTLYADEALWAEIPEEEIGPEMQRWADIAAVMGEAGVLISAEELQPTTTATTIVRGEAGDALTDGPFAETKEQLGGYYLLDCPDLDEALGWAKKLPLRAPSSIEVRPVVSPEQG